LYADGGALLVTGQVLPAFRESGDPTEPRASEIEVTAKPKAQTLARFADAAEEAYGGAGEPVPPTIVAKELVSLMLDPRCPGQPSAALTTALDAMFTAFSADGATFTAAEEQVWRTSIVSDGVLMAS
jgi:hypothetical protein